MISLEVAALYCAAGLVWLLALAFAVVRRRMQARISLGDGADEVLLRLIRTHGNAVEWLPPGLIGLLALAALPATPVWLVHACGAALLLGRILHGLALSGNAGPSAGRTLGIALSATSYLFLACGLIWSALIA